MKKSNQLFLTLALIMAVTTAKAQDVSPVAFLRMNPYQLNTDVATDLPYNSYFSVGIGNFGMHFEHPRFRYRDLFNFDSNGKPLSFNLQSFANSLRQENSMVFSMNENLLNLGFKLGDGMISFRHNFRMFSTANFNDGLFELLTSGNGAFLGEDNPAIVHLDLDAQAYQEYALGYQLRINKNLSVGARAKLLFGVADIKTDAFDMKLYTDPATYALQIQENVGVRFSLPRLFNLTEDGLHLDGPFGLADFYHNAGFGLDLAADYRINNQFSMTVAVNDLGFISWNYNNMELDGHVSDAGHYYDDGSFVFNGLDINQLQLIVSDDSYREAFLDTLKQYFGMQLVPAERYTTMLPTSFLLRGSFDVDKSNCFSAQFQGCILGDGFHPAMTLAYGGSFFGKIDVSATYTIMRHSYTNIGVGIGFNLGAFHIYGATANLLRNFTIGDNKLLDFQMGIVFNLRNQSTGIGTTMPDYF